MTAQLQIKNNFNWINQNDIAFLSLFESAINYVESKQKINDNFLNAISKQPSNQSDIKEFAQYYTPADVALYSAYQLLKKFDINKNIIFDPCAGKGSLLISIGVVLAIKYNLRDELLLNKLYGAEICEKTYFETIDNIIQGLSQWIDKVSSEKARKILSKNIKNIDFLNANIPLNSLVIMNPPYKETKGQGSGNIWLDFAEKITQSKNVQSFAMIVPVSICSADRTKSIRNNILNAYDEIIALHHDTRPRPLFKNIEQRISIIIAHKNCKEKIYSTTGFLTHNSGNRKSIWENEFSKFEHQYCTNVFPKVHKSEIDFFEKHFKAHNTLSSFVNTCDMSGLWVRTTGRYKLQAQYEKPSNITSKWKNINISKDGAEVIINDFSNGSALKWWKIFGDGRDLSINKFINNYGITVNGI